MMKPYPNCKDSAVPWLGKVPEHWEVLRLGSQFVERKEKVSDKDFAPLSVTKNGILPQLDTAAKSNDGDNRKKVCRGDFVINSRSDRKGSSGVSPYTGSVSLINTVLTPISLDGRYAHNFFRSHSFQEEFYRVGRGIVADLWSTKYADMRTIMIPVPTQDEQRQISRYLDWQTSKINKFIKAKKKLIALLKEQKQNIINEAVTKGINPNVKMKDSGIEWLGEIPAHWEIRRAKTICDRIIDCKNRTPPDGPAGGYRVIRTSDVKNGVLIDTNLTWTTKDGYEIWIQRGAPKEGDVFFTREAPCGEACLVPNNHNLCMGQRMMYFRPNRELLNSSYLLYSIYGPCVQEYIKFSNNGSTVGHLRLGQVYGLPIVWCPVGEQEQIVAHIEKETALIDQTISRTEREIELIQEYRTRLVSDVVTGKVDVRSVEIPDFEVVEADIDAQENEESEDEPITEDIEE